MTATNGDLLYTKEKKNTYLNLNVKIYIFKIFFNYSEH